MNDGLDQSIILLDAGEKPSKPYRSSAYTVRQYAALPYAQRRAVDEACDEAVGLLRTAYADESSSQPYTVGRATQPLGVKGAPQAPFTQFNPELKRPPLPHESNAALASPAHLPLTISPMTTTHPAPSLALHTLNTPEAIFHDATHPDSLATRATVHDSATGPACPYPGLPFAGLSEAVAEAATPAPPGPATAHETLVYETTEYDVFHLLPENRVIDLNHVRKLMGMIQQNNLLHLKPLDVTQDFGVIDGQHRLEAARQLGLPIFYKVGQQLSEADISTLNMAGKNWTGKDWLHYWTVKRKPAYVAFSDFQQRFPRISFSNAKMMLSPNTQNATELFRTGKWDGANEEQVAQAEEVAAFIERIADETTYKRAADTGFVAAVYYCVCKVEGFTAKQFLHKILANPRALVPCTSLKSYLQMFQEIYNFRTNQDNRLRFF